MISPIKNGNFLTLASTIKMLYTHNCRYMIPSDRTNKSCAWWEATGAPITVAVPVRTSNREGLSGTAIVPVIIRHKDDKSHVPIVSLQSRNAVMIILLLSLKNRCAAVLPWKNSFRTSAAT